MQTGDVPILVRVTDDSGNAGTGTAVLRRRHGGASRDKAERRRERRRSLGLAEEEEMHITDAPRDEL